MSDATASATAEAERILAADGTRWIPVSSGESGAAVRHDPVTRRHVKIVAAAQEGALAEERDKTRWLSSVGIPAAEVLSWRAFAGGAYLITRTVPGTPADQLGRNGLLLAWPSIIDAVRRLHGLAGDRFPFTWNLDSLMTVARANVGADRVHTEFLPNRIRDVPPAAILASIESQLPSRLAQEQASSVICHGDLCLPNILIDPDSHEVTGLIDVGRLGRADPYVDISLLLSNARGIWRDEAMAQRADQEFARRYGHPLDADRRQFYSALDPLTW